MNEIKKVHVSSFHMYIYIPTSIHKIFNIFMLIQIIIYKIYFTYSRVHKIERYRIFRKKRAHVLTLTFN